MLFHATMFVDMIVKRSDIKTKKWKSLNKCLMLYALCRKTF